MNRYEYVDGTFIKPECKVEQLRFCIPGSGGCILGVAEIKAGYPLQSNAGWGRSENNYIHYEQIHYNHIDWKIPEPTIRWNGEVIGKVLTHVTGNGGWRRAGEPDPNIPIMEDLTRRYPWAI